MKVKSKSQVKYGALISYILIVGNALFGLLVTPYVLNILGASSYGVYKSIGSFSNTLMVLDLGIGSTLMRYVAKYRAKAQNEKIGPFVSMMACEAGVLIPTIALVEVILFCQLDALYAVSFSAAELALAKQIYIVLAVNVLFATVENFLNGIITGYNNFIFGNGMKLLKLMVRIFLIYVLLPMNKSPLVLVTINLILSFAGSIIQLGYIIKHYHVKLDFNTNTWDKDIFRESFGYTVLTFLTVIAAQVNGNLDNVIIGSFCGADQVTVYSFALVIFAMFENLSTSISGVVLPTVSQIVVQDDWRTKVQAYIIKMGRVQFMLLGAAVVGFAILGKEFIFLWLGEGFGDVYAIVLILMIPSLFELCINGCLAVLRARNKLGFRTAILVLSTLLNLFISIAGIRYFGYFSAAFGTAASFAAGSLLIMNIYYYKKFGFRMFALYKGIMRGTVWCLLAAGAVIAVTSRFINGSWLAFLGNVLIFLVVYGCTMLLFGMTDSESNDIKKIFTKKKADVS